MSRVVGQIGRFSRDIGFTRLMGGFFGSPPIFLEAKSPGLPLFSNLIPSLFMSAVGGWSDQAVNSGKRRRRN